MITLFHVAGMLGHVAISIALIVIARLSQRLGTVTRVRPYYIGLYGAASLMFLSVIARLYFITRGNTVLEAQNRNIVYTLLSDGLPAVAVTLGLVVTWYYWSWLLAERD